MAVTASKMLPTFWWSIDCIQHDENDYSPEVYKMADIVRATNSVVVILGGSRKDADALLRDWGRRLWTFPEALLAPGSHVDVYFSHEGEDAQPMTLSKYELAARGVVARRYYTSTR